MEVGDHIIAHTKAGDMQGVVLPSSTKKTFVLKLSSGYNVGVPRKNVKTVSLVEKMKVTKEKDIKKIAHSVKKKTIAILHTGGTIASKVDYATGAVVAKYSPEEIVDMFPELEQLANIRSRLISNMSSDDMRFSHYNTMAKEVAKEIKEGADGIIITHGTDTIASSSAALSFILEDLPVPVLFVGSQRSSDRGGTDAFLNLMSAVYFMLESDFAEVGLCMHKGLSDDLCVILPGLKCRKMHSSRRDAFHAINAEPYAEVHFLEKKIHILDHSYTKKSTKELQLQLFKEVKIGWLRSRPQMFASELKAFSKYHGLLLEGTGMGHMPIGSDKENEKILAELKKLCKKMPVVMSLQTLSGRVDMHVYSPGRTLLDIGVLGNYSDMHPETAYIKLAWLVSNHPKEVRELFGKDLRGELRSRTVQ
ncbi:MAG TPA: Glu-tRNA(Gln) amidotransferase subunit GatD [Nanoarchaeota archaeon]|nr:Glu-tRNA(Gln) amidotransferase subunit GatD [Candidatus Woesearchaeota archaeon]HIH15416.1 Glu-tRNA(Gln) amidotransferase subunit GatD [Nanoarchaeota archaeon]HIH58916.1 Glu-tRNA(Gln) amidotransferase subunit GatD [Nanoarchaeota archaeon]HII13978.1 Glu-tRNA(Gln) amidotransferase subunit GatD [Nanoarchaeota archaeon]HIJ04760.1 Glu-tRNA(Gln) amidotransferase subunit GatD [Nanoarchaeota archaeon]